MTSSLRSINLNLLPVLRELLRKRNVTRAAEALNMRQSTVSEALGRIRELLHDEILVPQGRRLELTAYAARLEASLEESLAGLEALFLTPTFDPAELRGNMVVATADYVVLTIGPELARRLAKHAPGLTLQFVDISAASPKMLRLGEIDAIIAPLGVGSIRTEEFDDAFLFDDELVFMVDADRPESDLSEKGLLSSRFAAFCAERGDQASSFEGVVLNQLGARRFDAIQVMNFVLLPFLVEGTPNVALIQRSLAVRLAGSASVRLVSPTRPLPQVRIHLYWNKARTRDPGHRWFREQLAETAEAFMAGRSPS
ncbi:MULTISPECIES: LysR family transcriptional regulator [unclassified Sphingomonas]|uniref:LysR family transcriptional regulator n=1 Tax=unclassified Sphingomonas TaxID=196159 RepID=UPI001AC0B752|nr:MULTISPECIES: LysR family transcriptional regulator [unclassified Sphingomonas]MBN8847968.1 LysR family transcriptional regulator [Sphingomonas sp.]